VARITQLTANLIAALALGASIVLAHPATERYIPIGKSPASPQIGTIGVIEGRWCTNHNSTATMISGSREVGGEWATISV
jgi:hypothetical protein